MLIFSRDGLHIDYCQATLLLFTVFNIIEVTSRLSVHLSFSGFLAQIHTHHPETGTLKVFPRKFELDAFVMSFLIALCPHSTHHYFQEPANSRFSKGIRHIRDFLQETGFSDREPAHSKCPSGMPVLMYLRQLHIPIRIHSYNLSEVFTYSV